MNVNKVLTSRELSQKEWDQLWSKVSNTNMLQSWEYGEAKLYAEGWKPIRLVFEDEKNMPIGVTQILTKTIPIFGGVARLNRGPLLISTKQCVDEKINRLDILAHIKKVAKKRRWWFFYIAPEIKLTEAYQKEDLINLGYKERDSNLAWGSSLVSLKSEEELMVDLKGKWRNLLKKSQKSDLVIRSKISNQSEIKKLIDFYSQVKKQNNFTGISSNLLRCLSEQEGENWKFNYYIAEQLESSELAGMLVCVIHGDTATYLIGNTTDLGRKTNANYSLLWKAIIDSKNFGCKWFDLGGFNSNTPRGIRHFKEGLRGEVYNLIGEYRG